MVDCAAVLERLGIAEPLAQAVDVVAYNTEHSGALSQGVRELNRSDAPRWGLDEVVFLPPVEATSLRDFIAFEEHIRVVRGRPGRGHTAGLVQDARLLQGQLPVPAGSRATADVAEVLAADGL